MWYSMTWNLIHLKSNAVLDIVKIDYSFKVLDLEKVEYLVFLFFSFLFFSFFFSTFCLEIPFIQNIH